MNDELKEKIIDAGIEQLVRNVLIKTMTKYIGSPNKTDEVIKEINLRLTEEFKIRSEKAWNIVFEQMKSLMANQ